MTSRLESAGLGSENKCFVDVLFFLDGTTRKSNPLPPSSAKIWKVTAGEAGIMRARHGFTCTLVGRAGPRNFQTVGPTLPLMSPYLFRPRQAEFTT